MSVKKSTNEMRHGDCASKSRVHRVGNKTGIDRLVTVPKLLGRTITCGLAPNGVDLRGVHLFHGRSFRATTDDPLDGFPSPMGLSHRKDD